MKKLIAMLMTLALLACGAAALAEAGNAQEVKCGIEDGGYVIRIPDENGDLGWLADDMAQDETVVKLASAGLEGDEFVVKYEPVGDGEVSVDVKHYLGIACDRMFSWDLTVKDGAVAECTGGSYTEAPDEADQDPYLSGEWLEAGTQFTNLTIEKNEARGWNVEIAAPLTHGAYIFKTTVYYDCELDRFVYDKGKFWEVPITDSDEVVELGEAAVAGATGSFAFSEDGTLTWIDDEKVSDSQETVFERAD